MTPAETVAWEGRRRTPIALATIGAALFTAVGAIVSGVALGAMPDLDDKIVTVTDTLRDAAQGTPIPSGRLAEQALYLGNHAAGPIVGAVLYGLGTLLIFPAVAFLFRAARARRPELPQIALIMGAVGAVGYGVGRTVAEIARYLGAVGFVDKADHSNSAAADALSNSVAVAGQVIWQVGALAFGFAFVLVGLNAMRVGLLTRFMGIMGVIVGVTFVLPLDQQGIIRVFWLAALAVLLSGRWPRGLPPAWTTGEAVPWPSQQQLREQRAPRDQPERPSAGAASESTVDQTPAPRAPLPPAPRRPEPVTDQPHSASKKRKRKRRT